MASEMELSGVSEEETVTEASRPEGLLASSMSRMHLDAANKDENKDEDITGNSSSSPNPRQRRCKPCGDKERRRSLRALMKTVQKYNQKQMVFVDYQETLAELRATTLRLQQELLEIRLRVTQQDAHLREAHAGDDGPLV